MEEKLDPYLEQMVECPMCHNMVRNGDRIWKDGNCLCPDCYKHFMIKYYNVDIDKYKK